MHGSQCPGRGSCGPQPLLGPRTQRRLPLPISWLLLFARLPTSIPRRMYLSGILSALLPFPGVCSPPSPIDWLPTPPSPRYRTLFQLPAAPRAAAVITSVNPPVVQQRPARPLPPLHRGGSGNVACRPQHPFAPPAPPSPSPDLRQSGTRPQWTQSARLPHRCRC